MTEQEITALCLDLDFFLSLACRLILAVTTRNMEIAGRKVRHVCQPTVIGLTGIMV